MESEYLAADLSLRMFSDMRENFIVKMESESMEITPITLKRRG